MPIQVSDVLRLDSFKKMKLVGGKKGLHKSVNWIYVAECFDDPFESLQWVYGGEIVFITGRGIKGDKDLLTKLIIGYNEKGVAGLIINIGPYIDHISQKIIDLADLLELPLFELPWEIRITEATQEIYTAIAMARVKEDSRVNFFNELLLGKEDLDGNLVEKAAYFGYNLSGECRVYIIDIDDFSSYIKENTIEDELRISEIKTKVRKIVQDVLQRNNINAAMVYKNDSVIFIYKFDEKNIKILNMALIEIKEIAAAKINGLSLSIGIGNYYNGLNMMKNSLKEAELALKKIKLKNLKNCILEYKNIGVYKLLFSIGDKVNLEKYYYTTLNRIIEYDNINNSKLVETLEVFLEENCNNTVTAEKLFLHRNTLRYRIKKIEELLDLDLRDLNECIEVKIALEAGKIIKEK